MELESQQSPDQNIKKLGGLIKGIKFAMATTVDSKNNLHSCPLKTQQADFSGDLWFIVGKNSEFFSNIQKDSRVNISFTSDKSVFISITGSAELAEDKELLKKFWSPQFKVWFHEGVDDPNIALIQVMVDSAEYWEGPSFAVTRLAAFAKAFVTGDKKFVGEHHKLNLN